MTEDTTIENEFNQDYIERNENEFDFANRSNRTETISEFTDRDPENNTLCTLAGRIVRLNDLGNVIFADVRDGTSTVQFAFFEECSQYDRSELVVGDYIEATGTPTETDTGEFSLEVEEWRILTPVSRNVPMRTGLNEQQQSMDRVGAMITDEGLRESVEVRFDMITYVRNWLTRRGYEEVQTPILHNTASGAAATPFETYSESLDEELYLRIAPELYLKRLVITGFEQIFEIGRNFRNEDIDSTHNPEFTMLELYSAYSDYEDMMELTEDLVASTIRNYHDNETIEFDGNELDFSPPWPRYDYFDLIEQQIQVEDIREINDENLFALVEEHSQHEVQTRADAYEELYDNIVEPNLISPCFVLDHPRESTPLCSAHTENNERAERFEAVVSGIEIANAYTELTNPLEQQAAFEQQTNTIGDQNFVEDLGYGMPPTGGLGIGLDRLAMIVSQTPSIRRVLPFPLTNQN